MVILDNSVTAMTGHQENPGTGMTLMGEQAKKIDILKLVRDGLGITHSYEVDGYQVKEIGEILKREIERDEPSVILVKRPCVLLFRKANWSPLKVDREKCIACKMCLKLGCPAISMKDGKSNIGEMLCSGCTVCAQVCPTGAIGFLEKDGLHILETTVDQFLSGEKR